jgi:hypothetical protein
VNFTGRPNPDPVTATPLGFNTSSRTIGDATVTPENASVLYGIVVYMYAPRLNAAYDVDFAMFTARPKPAVTLTPNEPVATNDPMSEGTLTLDAEYAAIVDADESTVPTAATTSLDDTIVRACPTI